MNCMRCEIKFSMTRCIYSSSSSTIVRFVLICNVLFLSSATVAGGEEYITRTYTHTHTFHVLKQDKYR
jgi:hypothetical protein